MTEIKPHKEKGSLPAAIVLLWDDHKVTVLCPFCNRAHTHGITHFKIDPGIGGSIQDDCGRYVYDGPSPTRCDSRVPHCELIHWDVILEYVIVFPFEDDVRVKGLSFEIEQIEQVLDDDETALTERFRTVGLDTAIMDILEEPKSCYSDESPEERELRKRLRYLSLDYGDYDVTTTFNIKGERVEITQRASVWVAASACSGNLDDLKRFLNDSPNRNWLLRLQDEDGQSLLGLAVPNGHSKVVEYLLEERSDVNVVDAKGRTPLMEAALWGFPGIVKMLLRAGSDKSLRDRRGMTAADLAEESERHDRERHERSLKYSEDPFIKKRDRTLIRALLEHQTATSLPKPLHASDLIDAYFYKSSVAGTISLVMPKRGMKTSTLKKTTAILLRGDAFPPVAAVSGWTGPISGDFRSPDAEFETLNEGYWALESMQMAKNIGFSFKPHYFDKKNLEGSYNACHAEAQAMCFFVTKNYIFRDYEEGEREVEDDFLQLFMLQPRNRHAEIIISNAPCLSCMNLRDCIRERLGIDFDFKQLQVR
jgi:hypothetical protein